MSEVIIIPTQGKLDYRYLRAVGKVFLHFQKDVQRSERILSNLLKLGYPEDALLAITGICEGARISCHRCIENIYEETKDHPLWYWIDVTKGLGKTAGLLFFGFINPLWCTSAGKVHKFWGLCKGQRKKRGERTGFPPILKGKAWVIVRNVIRAKDEYYVPLYKSKKQYYLNREFQLYINDPQLCPKYEECKRKILEKARRLGRKPKKIPCRDHVDGLARRFLAKILTSHAWEIMRRFEGLEVPRHWNHIPPKHDRDDTPLPELVENILRGRRARRWIPTPITEEPGLRFNAYR